MTTEQRLEVSRQAAEYRAQLALIKGKRDEIVKQLDDQIGRLEGQLATLEYMLRCS